MVQPPRRLPPMIGRWNMRVADVASWRGGVVARCIAWPCTHAGAPDWRRLKPDDRLRRLEPRLRCTVCRSRGNNVFELR